VLSTTLLANVPELGTATHRQIAALADVAPLNCDCGTLAWETDGGGRTCAGPGDTLQPGNQDLLSALMWAGQDQEGGSQRLYAETADDTQRDIRASDALANGTVSPGMTVKTVTDPAIHGVVLPG
jgi:hypothetical protein